MTEAKFSGDCLFCRYYDDQFGRRVLVFEIDESLSADLHIARKTFYEDCPDKSKFTQPFWCKHNKMFIKFAIKLDSKNPQDQVWCDMAEQDGFSGNYILHFRLIPYSVGSNCGCYAKLDIIRWEDDSDGSFGGVCNSYHDSDSD